MQELIKLTAIVTLQLNQGAIQFFKDRKLSMYYKAMQLFSDWEIKNSEHVIDLFSNIVGLNETLI